MAVKKRKKKKSARSSRAGSVNDDSDGHRDKLASNKEKKCSCLDGILAMGFDPYVTVKHYPSQISHQTKAVYGAKRAVQWTEAENNKMSWEVEELNEDVLSIALWDEEVGEDPQIGTALLLVDDWVKINGMNQPVEFDISIKRGAGNFAGSLTCNFLVEKKNGMYRLTLVIDKAQHLKKERETDVSTDTSTMFWIMLVFMSYLCILGGIFFVIEDPDKIDIAEDDPDTEYDEEYGDLGARCASWWDGFWFVFITATTVGYGDFFPKTALGRYLNCFVIIADVLFIGFALGLIVDFIAASAERAQHRMSENKNKISEDERVEKLITLRSSGEDISEVEINEVEQKEEESDDEETLAAKERAKFHQMFIWDMIIHCGLVVILIFGGSCLYWQKENWRYPVALHFCFVTMSTVGYGDISLANDESKVFTIFYIVFGVGLLVRLGGLVCDKVVESQQRKIAQKRADESLMHWEQIAEFDVEGDGELNLYEFSRAMLKATGKVASFDLEQIDERFSAIDRDGSGYITKDDFAILQRERAEKEARQKEREERAKNAEKKG